MVDRKSVPYVRLGLGLALLIGLIWHFDTKSIIKAFAGFQMTWLLAAILLILIATLVGAFNRHLLVDLEGKIPFRTFLSLYWVAWAMGLVIPGQIGDVAALSAMLRRKGMQWPESLGRSLVDKLISFALMMLLGTWGVLLVAAAEFWVETKTGITLVTFSLLTVSAIFLFWRRDHLSNYFSHGKTGFAGAIGDTARELLATFAGHPGKVMLNATLTLVSIVLIGTAYWCTFVALGYTEVPLGKLILLVAACAIVAYVPVSFNGIGTVEITGIVLFGFLGIPAPVVLSAYLCLRLVVMSLAWLPAAMILIIRRSAITSTSS